MKDKRHYCPGIISIHLTGINVGNILAGWERKKVSIDGMNLALSRMSEYTLSVLERTSDEERLIVLQFINETEWPLRPFGRVAVDCD